MPDDKESVGWKIGIKNRAKLAREWQAEWKKHQDLAESFRYVRVQGDGFSAISISGKNPCGRLIGRDGHPLPNLRPTVGEAVRDATDALRVDDPIDYQPGAEKKEHKMQAFLIRHALLNNKSMQGVFLGFGNDFDELLFVTDELPAPEHRADIIALGRKADRYFPVFIELKVRRDLTELRRQLNGIRDAMSLVKEDFIEYLAAASGVVPEKISFDEHRLMLVWMTPTGRERAQVDAFRQDENGITACYQAEGDDGYTFVRWPKA